MWVQTQSHQSPLRLGRSVPLHLLALPVTWGWWQCCPQKGLMEIEQISVGEAL